MRGRTPRTPLGQRLTEQVEYARPRRMDLWPAIAEQIEAQHGRRVKPDHHWLREGFRLAGAIAAVVVFALIVARMFEPGTNETGSQPTPSVVPTSTAPVTIPVGGHPDGVAFAAGSIWVANHDDGTLSRIDPATNQVVATILIEDTIGLAATKLYPSLLLAVSGDDIWVVPIFESGSKLAYSLVKVNPETNEVEHSLTFIRSIQALAVDPSGDSLWLSSVDTDFLRLDTETGAEIAGIDVAGSSNIIATDDAVWVLRRSGPSSTTNSISMLRRIDPSTNTVIEEADVELQDGRNLTFTAGSVWVTDRSAGKVHRIDPATNQIIASLDVAGANNIAGDQSSVWVTSETAQSVIRIDPTTNQIARIYPNLPATSIGVGSGSVWITNASTNTVMRLTPLSSP